MGQESRVLPSPSLLDCTPPRLRVAAVQMVFAETISGNLEKIKQAAISAADERADVVLFPEWRDDRLCL